MKYLDEEIIYGIKCDDSKILNYCYRTYFKTIKQYVIKNKGTIHDAKDIFQETLEYLFLKPEIIIKKKFTAFFCTICYNKWKHKLREMKNTEITETIAEDSIIIEPFEELEYLETYNLKYEIFNRHFERLDEICRKLLIMFYSKDLKGVITKDLGIAPGYINRRKSMCKQKLRDYIRNDDQNFNNTTNTFIL